jgi:NAD(P)-dependent dehydrogenase (short-subunit alcohol dehydrogenase family)
MSDVVIVTGAGSEFGIGQAVARRLLEAGSDVALVDVNAEGLADNAARFAELRGRSETFACDVGSREAVFETAAAVEASLGPAWGLVNCAVGAPYGPAEDITEEDWRHGFDITVHGAFWWCQAVFPQMKAHGGGRIVNFGSEASDQPEPDVSLNYTSAKGAVRSLTRGLAFEWGTHGITVNTVWPVAATPAQQTWAAQNPERAAQQLAQTALHRFGDPYADIAPVVQFLLSRESGFVSGVTVPADGGRAMP